VPCTHSASSSHAFLKDTALIAILVGALAPPALAQVVVNPELVPQLPLCLLNPPAVVDNGGAPGVAVSGNSDCPLGTSPAAEVTDDGGIAIGNSRTNPTRTAGTGNSVAIGNGARAGAAGTGNATAIGFGAIASGNNAAAFGAGANAGGADSLAAGSNARANGAGSIALGSGALATSANGIAIGTGAQAGDTVDLTRVNTIAIGNNAQATAQNSTAVGDGASAGQVQATAVGSGAVAGTNGTAVGRLANAGNSAVAYGVNASAGLRGTALGQGADSSGADSMAVGSFASATVADSVALGRQASVTAANSVALGRSSTASRGAQAGYAATGIAVPQTSIGEVAIGTAAGERQLTGLAAGSAATDAVNVAQLQGIDAQADALGAGVAASLGSGAAYDPATGTLTQPSYTVQGSAHTSVGAALGALDTQTTINTSAITAIDNRVTVTEAGIATNAAAISALNNGSVGLVQQAGPAAVITVAMNTGGAVVSFTGASGDRQLVGVAAGTVSASSNHAVNGSQLHGTSQSVANALGGGASVDANGAVTAPSYAVQGASHASVGGAVTALDSQLTATNAAVSTLQGQTSANSGAIAANSSAIAQLQGQSAANTGAITNLQTQVAGNSADITSLQGQMSTNTTAITNLTNAVNSGTVGLVQQAAPGAALTVGAQTDGSAVDFTGTAGARQLTGVAAGTLNAASTDAVNGSQLAATNVRIQTLIDEVANQQIGGFTSNNIAGAARPSATGANAAAGGSGAVASGAGATAIGNGSQATGQNTTALGNNAQATGTNSVAIGTNASDGGMSDVVSVGSSAATRRVVYVSAGIAPTDAVNVGQLQSGMAQTLASANQYTDGRIAALGFDLDTVREDSRRGIAAVAALGYAPMPSEPGRTSYSVNGAFFRDHQAIGGSIAHRLNTEAPIAATAGFAYGGNGNNIVRVGVAGEF